MTRNRNPHPTLWRFTASLLLAAAALVAACSGCHGHYNRYAPARLLQRADRLETAAERALDNAERRADNVID
jgi:hypothetical protein